MADRAGGRRQGRGPVDLVRPVRAQGDALQPIVDKIYADLAEILQMADVKEKFAAGGGDVGGMKPAEFTAQIKREAEKLLTIVKAADVKPE